jgi:hypothetical protein
MNKPFFKHTSAIKHYLLIFVTSGCMLSAPFNSFADQTDLSGLPEPPDIPPPIEDDQPMDKDVRIYRKEKKTIHEYRVNGELYYIKVVPDIGPTYYLRDQNGDGAFERFDNSGLDQGMKVQQWRLFSW